MAFRASPSTEHASGDASAHFALRRGSHRQTSHVGQGSTVRTSRASKPAGIRPRLRRLRGSPTRLGFRQRVSFRTTDVTSRTWLAGPGWFGRSARHHVGWPSRRDPIHRTYAQARRRRFVMDGRGAIGQPGRDRRGRRSPIRLARPGSCAPSSRWKKQTRSPVWQLGPSGSTR